MTASIGHNTAQQPDISVVAPMYNEELCVEEFLRRTDAALRAMSRPYEIVVVSDGSTDRTEELLRASRHKYPALRAILLARNVGQCSALYAGIQATTGRMIIVTDGDLQHRPEDIHLLIERLEQGYQLVSGTREQRPESRMWKLIPSKIANWLLRRVTGCDIRDMGGFKAMDGAIARSLRLRPGHHRLLPALVHMRGGATSELPIQCQPRFAGKSHYGIGRTFDVIFDILMLGFQSSFKARPLYLFGRVGVLLLLVDCLIMPWLLWEKFRDVFDMGESVDMGTRPPFLIAIMFFLAALFFLAMGFVLELLSDANNAIGGVKPYVVREIVRGDGETTNNHR
ncbi:MAG: glycosyltransferase family 2 protein [Limnohabitans sp.]|nr:glycosyltransferase family 2 protein [Limnohabitans sp.]